MGKMKFAGLLLLLLSWGGAACDSISSKVCCAEHSGIRVLQKTEVIRESSRGALLQLDERRTVIAILEPGEEVRLLDVIYGKDFRAVKVELPDQREGYCVDRGTNIRWE